MNKSILEMRRGDWVQTFTGKAFWPLDPRPEEVCIEDIAHHLSMKARYNGGCHTFYSVAEHSILVAQCVPPEFRFAALLHDASETYLPDVAGPIKPHIPGWREIEDRVDQAIATRFGIPWPIEPLIKFTDYRILHNERLAVLSEGPAWTRQESEPLDVRIDFLSPREAEKEFLTCFSLYKTG